MKAGNPERFYDEQSKIAHAMNDLALRVAGNPRKGAPTDERQARKSEQTVTAIVNGHPVLVRRRRPGFSVFVG